MDTNSTAVLEALQAQVGLRRALPRPARLAAQRYPNAERVAFLLSR